MLVKYTDSNISVGHSRVVEVTDTTKKDEVHKRTELDVQRALDETGFGKFNYKVVAINGLICMNVGFSLATVGFILPSAACDFDMDTVDKGHLSTAPIFGMLCGACIWGCIADTKGRRLALLQCLFLQAFAEFTAAIVPNYWGFLFLKFSSGLGLSGQMAILYTYLGEFQPTKYREKMLSLMEIPSVFGIISTPLLAWITIPLDVELEFSGFSFKSWNLFVIISAVPAFLIGCSLIWLPETPKFLAQNGYNTELHKVLAAMYGENTGNASEEYPVILDTLGIKFTNSSNGPDVEVTEKTDYRISTMSSFSEFFKTLYTQAGMLFRPPYLSRMFIISFDSFCILSSLYTLTLWFPELFQRFADYEKKYPGMDASICLVSRPDFHLLLSNDTIGNSSLLIDQMNTFVIPTFEECDSTIEPEVYTHTLILGFAAIPVALTLPLCVHRLGFRLYLVFCSFVCCAVTIGMLFVTNSTQNLVLSCMFDALISICSTVVFCLVVELFPTHLRVSASVLSAILSRAGALIGNTLFGYLIDDHCYLLIAIITVELFVAGVLAFFIPDDSRIQSKKKLQMKVKEPQEIESNFPGSKCSINNGNPS